jgi:hypothetical protein
MVSFFTIKGFGLLAMLKNASFDILKFWIHHSSSYLVNRNIKRKNVLCNLLNTLNSNPITTKLDVNHKVCNATFIRISNKNFPIITTCWKKKCWRWIICFLNMLQGFDEDNNHSQCNQKLSSVHCEQWIDISWHRTIKMKRKEQ